MADPGGGVAACTIVARNYLPAARVLARSYLEHHPGHDFVVAVIDAATDDLPDERQERFRVAGREAFGIAEDEYLRMATAYTVTELATAVKPYLLRELRRDAQVAIYLDPDIQVFAPMPEVAELARAHAIVLTPHFTAPLPRDGKEPDEAAIMGSGIFNLGFLGVGPGSQDFLEFWAQRLRFDAIVAPERQLFTDQRWVDQVPALFRHHVLTDPGFNVAYWNLHERSIGRDERGTVTAGGRALRFFHFSGYRPETSWLLTMHCPREPRVLLSDNAELRALCDEYGAALRAAGYAETLDAVPYGFADFADGTPIPPMARRLFRAAWMETEHPRPTARRAPDPVPPHAFGADGGTELRAWLASPADAAQAAAGLNRLAMEVWESRTDLRLAFPHPCDADAEGFRTWCRHSGLTEGMLLTGAVPVDPAVPSSPDGEFGVNLLGYLTAELGVGEMGRIVHDALTNAGVPVTSVLEERMLFNRTGVARPDTVAAPRFPISVLAVNADQTRVMLASHPDVAHERYRIGLWAWELEDFPAWQHEAFGMVDEVWTVSEFCRAAIAEHSPVPVKTIPVPVPDPGEPPARQRGANDPIDFLFVFDFNSVAQRKNPWGAVTAFRRAFGDRGGVRLTLKTINGDRHPKSAERLRAEVAGDDRIVLIEHYLSTEDLHELYRRADCYVSLHRSEGFGLTVAEAMARALPVICTDYSSTAEFVDESCGWPIPYRMTEVGKDSHPYHEGAFWADPDLDAAAAAMRAVADDPAEAARRGVSARERIVRGQSVATAAAWMRTELEAAYAAWQARRATASASPPEHPLTPMRQARESLRWRADAGADARNPLAPALRKATLRVIDHYDVHQREVLGALYDGSEDTAARLLHRIEALEAAQEETRRTATRTALLEQRVTALKATVDRLNRAGPGTDATLRQLDTEIDRVAEAVRSAELAAHDGFAARDERMDQDEEALRRVIRDVAAAHAAAAVRHAPVPEGAEVVLCDAGALLLPADDVVLPWVRFHRSWEPSEAALMAALAGRNSGAFLDIGAHVGYHTLRLLRGGAGVRSVVAVEADPENAAFLRRNLDANLPPETRERVAVLPVAAWDTDAKVRLIHAGRDNSGDHRVTDTAETGGAGTIRAVRLDTAPELTGLTVGLVKVDLQGRDHRALAGLHAVLARDQPHVVCEFCPEAIEELGDDPAQVLAGYRKLGYRPAPVLENAAPDVDTVAEHPDGDLIRAARADERGFLTLWLRPA